MKDDREQRSHDFNDWMIEWFEGIFYIALFSVIDPIYIY